MPKAQWPALRFTFSGRFFGRRLVAPPCRTCGAAVGWRWRARVGTGFAGTGDLHGSTGGVGNLPRQRVGAPAPISQKAGSGFIVAPDGMIVSNNYVIFSANKIMVTLNNGLQFSGKFTGSDNLIDIAIIKIAPPSQVPAAVWGDPARARVGHRILAAGNAVALDDSFAAGVTPGIKVVLTVRRGSHIIEIPVVVDRRPAQLGG